MTSEAGRHPLRTAAQAAADELAAKFPGRLQAVVLYGSLARGEARAAGSDANLLAVFDEVNASVLEDARAVVARHLPRGVAVPVFVETSEVGLHTRLFAVEMTEVLRHREVLFGRDPFGKAKVQAGDVTLQVAFEAHRCVMRLRRAYLSLGADAAAILRVTLETYGTGKALVAAMLRQRNVSGSGAGLFERAEKSLGLHADAWKRLEKAAAGESRPTDPDVRFLFGDLLEEMETLAGRAEGGGGARRSKAPR